MATQLATYLRERSQFLALDHKCTDLAKHVFDMCSVFEQWRTIAFTNADVRYPDEHLGAETTRLIDLKAWPTPILFLQASVEWHETKVRMLQAWEALTDAERANLAPPPIGEA